MTKANGPALLRRRDGGGVFTYRLQRSRLLEATFSLVAEEGYQGVTVRKVAGRAGVSSRTFYELFTDREDCFLAAFDHGVGELAAAARPAYEAEGEWVAAVRAGLAALLVALECEPALRRLVFVEALAAGPRVLARRAEVLEQLAGVVDRGRVGMADAGLLADPGRAALVAEGVVGSVFGVLYTRLSQWRSEPLLGLLGSLMATVVLPYRGGAAAARELARPAPDPATVRPAGGLSGPVGRPLGSALPADFRLTVRTQMVLVAVAGHAGVNNRELSGLVGLSDQGQISKMASRLREQGLIEDTRGRGRGAPKAWRLTPHGEAVIDAHRGGWDLVDAKRKGVRGGKLMGRRGREGRGGVTTASASRASTSFRMTVRTHLVLTAIARLSEGDFNPSNVEVADAAGVRDQGQISKLLARLESHGLLQNTGGVIAGSAKAWELTPRGEEVIAAGRPLSERAT